MPALSGIENIATGVTIASSENDRVIAADQNSTIWVAASNGTNLVMYYKKVGGAWTAATTTRDLWSNVILRIDAHNRIFLVGADARKLAYGKLNGAGDDWVWETDVTLEGSGTYRLEDMGVAVEGSNSLVTIGWSRYYTTTSTNYCTEYRWEAVNNASASPTGNNGDPCASHTGSFSPSGTQSGWTASTSCPLGSRSHNHSVTCFAPPYNPEDAYSTSVTHSHNVSSCYTIDSRSVACGSSTNYYSYVYRQTLTWTGTGAPSDTGLGGAIGGNFSSSGHSQVWVITKPDLSDVEVLYKRNNSTFYANKVTSAGVQGQRNLSVPSLLSHTLDSVLWDGTGFVFSTHSGSSVAVYSMNATTGATTELMNVSNFGESVTATSLSYDQSEDVLSLLAHGATLMKRKTREAGTFSNWASFTLDGAPTNISTSPSTAGGYLCGALTDNGDLDFATMFRFNSPPIAPVVVGPVPGTRVWDGDAFVVTHVDADGDAPSEYAFRVDTDAGYRWWNGSAFVASETFLAAGPVATGDTLTISIPGAAFTDRSVRWSVATKDATDPNAGPYSVEQVVLVAPPNEGWGSVDAGHERV